MPQSKFLHNPLLKLRINVYYIALSLIHNGSSDATLNVWNPEHSFRFS